MKKKLLTIIFGVLFFNPQFITAQNTSKISGYIIDSNSKNPLIGVNISITKSKGATTNTNGYFELTNLKEGKYILKVSMVGYKSIIKKLTIKNGETKKINFKLIESIQALDDVTITAKSKAREIRENALPVSVISIKDIQGTVSNVGEILTKTAGIKIRSFGGVGSESRISVRGLEGKRIGFFIDGTPLSDQSDFIGVNDIPTDLIDRIEVYKGIVPAKFGGSAIGGAVNIVTKELPPTYVDFNYSMQSYNTHNANIIYKKNNKEKGYEFGGGILYTYSDNNYTMESPFNPDLKIKRDHDEFEKKFIGVNFKAKKWWFDVVVFEPFLIQSRKEIQGITQNIQEAVSTADAYGLTNQMQKKDFLTEGLDLDFGVGYGYSIFKFQDKAMQRYNWDGTTYAPVTTFGGEIGSTPNDAVIKKHTLMQKTNLNYILNDNSTINLNTVYTYAHGNPKDDLRDQVIGYKTNYESKMKSLVTGLNYEVRFLENKLTSSTSLKYYFYNIKTTLVDIYLRSAIPHNFQKNDVGFNTAFRYRFTKDFLIKASYAYDVRLPSENELLGDGFIVAPAGNLEPERNSSMNLGFIYDHTNNNDNKLQFEFNVFYMQLENLIRFTGGFLQSQYQNFGESRTLGADVDMKLDITKNIYLYANATYQDLRDTRKKDLDSNIDNPTKGDRIPNIPYLYANAGFELHKENLFGGKEQNSKFYFESSFVEEYFYDFEQSVFQNRRIPRTLTYNLGLEHSFKNRNISIGLQINNITDERVLSIFNRPLPGRTAGIRLRYVIK